MKLIKYIRFGMLAVIVLGIVAYGGACVWANWIAGDGKTSPPAVDQAAYAVQIASTRQVIFTDEATRKGSVVTIQNYYEYNGKTFLYRKATVNMDERYFGEIRVVKRATE
jgi:hypothetical protein